MVQALDMEVSQFNIRTLYVAPGGFRTNFVQSITDHAPLLASSSNPKSKDADALGTGPTLIDDYGPLREAGAAFVSTVQDKMRGDPVKGARVMVDVVKGEGCARGREMPKRLFLGSDAYTDTRANLEGFLGEMELSRELTQGMTGGI